MIDEKIKRINELSKKRKTVGLTEEEEQERKALHREYIDSIKANLRVQLNSIKVVEPGSNVIDLDDSETWTEEQKANVEYLSNKLGKELQEQNARDDQLRTTINGNPSNPVGEDGQKMLERMNESHKELTDWGLDFLPKFSPVDILDIGCGGGAAIKNLSKRYPLATIYGIDTSEVSVEKTLEVNRDKVVEDKVRVTQGSVENLPFGKDFFNLVISVESYFFWPNFQDSLKQIYNVLKDNGRVLIIAELYKGVEYTETEKLMKEKFAQNLLTPEEFEAEFKEAGFKDIQVHTKEGTHWICVEATK